MKSSCLTGLSETALAFEASTDNVTIGVRLGSNDLFLLLRSATLATEELSEAN
jgi:hypothetical protein